MYSGVDEVFVQEHKHFERFYIRLNGNPPLHIFLFGDILAGLSLQADENLQYTAVHFFARPRFLSCKRIILRGTKAFNRGISRCAASEGRTDVTVIAITKAACTR